MRDHSAIDRDVQKLRAAINELEALGDHITDEGLELRAECDALMGRLTRILNGHDKDEAVLVSKRVRAAYTRARSGTLRLLPYSPVDPTEGSSAPGAA